jgi:hypothetical protein
LIKCENNKSKDLFYLMTQLSLLADTLLSQL